MSMYGPGAPSLERYRDETIPNWHDRLVGEVALRARKRAYAERVASSCRKPGCRSCRRDAENAVELENEAFHRLSRELKRLRRRKAAR